MKQCGHCGADISDRSANSRYCTDAECHRQRMLAHGRASYARHRAEIRERQNAAHRARMAAKPQPQRFCAHCGKDISHRRYAKWCDLRCRDKFRHRANPTRARHRAAVRRAAPGRGLSAEQWRRMLHRHLHRCAYCGSRAEKLTQDHVVPLSRGGTDSEGNIVPACGDCNARKGDRLLAEWRYGCKGRRPGAYGRRPGVMRPRRAYQRS